MKQNNHSGAQKLARVLQDRMMCVGEQQPLLDFALIQADFSLLANNFPIPIPKTDYLICRGLSLDTSKPIASIDGTEIRLPDSMNHLRGGDRVIIAWVGNDAVVIDRIVTADRIGVD